MENKNTVKLILILIIGVTLVGIKMFGTFSIKEKNVQNETQKSEAKEFNVKAFRFGYTPDEIIVNKGDRVKIIINNIDTIHGINIPKLGVSGNDVVEFIADKTGEFEWFCNNLCGLGHMQMKGKLIVK